MHEARPVRPHDRVPLQIGADQQVAETGAVVAEKAQCIIRIEGNQRQHDVDPPLATKEKRLVGLVDILGHGDGNVDFRAGGSVALKVVGSIILHILGEVMAGAGRRAAIKKTGETEVDRRQIVGGGGDGAESEAGQSRKERTDETGHWNLLKKNIAAATE